MADVALDWLTFVIYLLRSTYKYYLANDIMDRESLQRNEVYYIIGIVSLCISLGLFALSFYILPNLAFGWRYELPEFVPVWINLLQESYHLSEKASAWVIFLGLFLPALLLVIIADILSNRVENRIYHLEEERPTQKRAPVQHTESSRLILKILGIIILVFVAAQFFQWIISTMPAQTV